jgi:hypothetical protein
MINVKIKLKNFKLKNVLVGLWLFISIYSKNGYIGTLNFVIKKYL